MDLHAHGIWVNAVQKDGEVMDSITLPSVDVPSTVMAAYTNPQRVCELVNMPKVASSSL